MCQEPFFGLSCSLTGNRRAIWAFVGPVIIVICFNSMVYVRIIAVVVSAEVLVPGDLSFEDAEKYEKHMQGCCDDIGRYFRDVPSGTRCGRMPALG